MRFTQVPRVGVSLVQLQPDHSALGRRAASHPYHLPRDRAGPPERVHHLEPTRASLP
eukprot:COSAG06_NODE_2740_length_6360_cov_4.271362_6_plen_57_part_00